MQYDNDPKQQKKFDNEIILNNQKWTQRSKSAFEK